MREPWRVDPLTWRTYVRTLTDPLDPREAERLRDAFEDRGTGDASDSALVRSGMRGHRDPGELSEDGRAVFRLLTATDPDGAEAALRLRPPSFQARLTAMSPASYLDDIEAPLIVLLHDRYDAVIPVGESRRLGSALSGRAGARYTELGLRHLDPTRLSPLRLARELPRFYRAMYPLFRQAMA